MLIDKDISRACRGAHHFAHHFHRRASGTVIYQHILHIIKVLGHTYPTLKQHLDAIEVNSVEAEVDTKHYGDRTTSWANLKILDLSQNSTGLSYRLIGSVNASIPQLGYAECFIEDLQTQTA